MLLILLTIGIAMIIYNYRGIKRENELQRDEDVLNISFQSVLQDNKEELNDYKIEIGLLRRDIGESLTELQEEIVDIKNNMNRLKNYEKRYENKEYLKNEIYSDTESDYNKINDIKVENINKIDQIIGESGEKLFFDRDVNEEILQVVDFPNNVDSSKTKSIKKLLKDGLTEEEICRKLSVSKGEILLVKNLFEK